MNEIVTKILLTTYSIVVSALIGYIATQIRKFKAARQDHVKANADLQYSMSELSLQVAGIDSQLEKLNNLETQVETLGASVTDIGRTVKENEMRTSRYRIIRFDDEMTLQGVEHSDDHCDQILEDCDIYNAYCKAHPEFQNHKGQGAMHRILNANQSGNLKKGRKTSA